MLVMTVIFQGQVIEGVTGADTMDKVRLAGIRVAARGVRMDFNGTFEGD